MYLVVCEFLLLKPDLDVANVPEFYKLFYSSSLEVMICFTDFRRMQRFDLSALLPLRDLNEGVYHAA